MNSLIIADLEGVHGVYSLSSKEKCSLLFTNEIKIYINALIKNGVRKITVCDAHSYGNTISDSIIRDNVCLVSKLTNISFEENYDFALLIGFHGKSQSEGIFPHTMRSDIRNITLDSKAAGEVEIYSRWLGSKGIPVILVTGDSEAIFEANVYNPYRQVCCVKSLKQQAQYTDYNIYEKIYKNVEVALKLDFSLCISNDSDELMLELINDDVTKGLEGYQTEGNLIRFASCAEFVNQLDSFFLNLNNVTRDVIQSNLKFINTLKKMTKVVKKELIDDPLILELLDCELIELDTKTKSVIEKEFERVWLLQARV